MSVWSVSAVLLGPWASFVLCLVRGPGSASELRTFPVPHWVHAFEMLWPCLCERTPSLLEAVICLHVSSVLILLLTLSHLPLFYINLVYVKSGICCCICSDLVIRFHRLWDSTHSCTGVVHVPACTSEPAQNWSVSFSPLLLSPRSPGAVWSILVCRLESLCPASLQHFLFMMDTGMSYCQLTWFR